MAAPLKTIKKIWIQVKHLQKLSSCRYLYSGPNSNILALHERGVFQNIFPEISSPELLRKLVSSPQCFYCGFDPTAESLHVGNLLAVMALLHCQRGGHNVIALIGGATAQIGDPSGKSKDRECMDLDTIQHNVTSIGDSLHRIFTNHQQYLWKRDKELKPVRILDNAEWYSQRNVIEFISNVGRTFRMGDLLSRHSVKSRLESAEGLNFTEFSYQVFQAYDWLYLLKKYNCTIQIGGNDQIGNMTSGHFLISRTTKQQSYGITVPLITTTSGHKLGKTAGNAVWLNPKLTSPFEFYQFFVRQADDEVEKYLKLFTFLPDVEIKDIMIKHKRNPESWWAQKKLAENVTILVHGEEGLASALRCTEALYGNSAETLATLTEVEMNNIFHGASTSRLTLEPGMSVIDTVMKANCFRNKADADRIIRAGGIYINYRRVSEPDYVLIPGEHILPNNITVIRVGKRNYHLVKWTNRVF